MSRFLTAIVLACVLFLCIGSVARAQEGVADQNGVLLDPQSVIIQGEKQPEADPVGEVTKKALEKLSQLPPEIQQDLLKEADVIFDYCRTNFTLSNFYDCSCYALSMLDQRIDKGPDVPYVEITQEGKFQQCVSSPLIAGFAYKRCENIIMMRQISDETLEAICSCTGKTMIEKFSTLPAADIGYIDNLFTESLIACQGGAGG